MITGAITNLATLPRIVSIYCIYILAGVKLFLAKALKFCTLMSASNHKVLMAPNVASLITEITLKYLDV